MMENSEKRGITERFSAKRIALLACLTALSLICFAIENLFPPFFVPGAKLGLANVFSLFALLALGYGEALVVIVVRTVLGSLLTGAVSSLAYSLTAGVVSVSLASLLVRFAMPRISLVAVSATSAVAHNLVQNLVFVLTNATPEMLAYAPYLALVGLVSGAFVGVVVNLIIRKLPYNLLVGIKCAQ